MLLTVREAFLRCRHRCRYAIGSSSSNLHGTTQGVDKCREVSRSFLLSLPHVYVVGRELCVICIQLTAGLLRVARFAVGRPNGGRICSNESYPKAKTKCLSSGCMHFAMRLRDEFTSITHPISNS